MSSYQLVGSYERLGGGEKDDLALGKPAVKVEHDNSRNEGFAETSGENNEGVLRSMKDDEKEGRKGKT